MKYPHIERGIFLSRPNRFIAMVEMNGRTEKCHVKNTGRCKELLIPGTEVFVNRADNPSRATRYDLITVRKGEVLINIDSQAPNKVFLEYLQSGQHIEGITHSKPEARYGKSRFDFYVEAGQRRIFIEVKGVTLEVDGVALFPDAPTLRGVKHVNELAACIAEGYEAQAVFVVQMSGVRYFSPNSAMHPGFGEALATAKAAGVSIIAMDCMVSPDSLEIRRHVPVEL